MSITLFCVNKILLENYFVKLFSLYNSENYHYRGNRKNAAKSSYRSSFNFTIHHETSISLSQSHPNTLEGWSVCNARKAGPFYSTEIRLVAEKVVYDETIPTGVAWLKLRSCLHNNRQHYWHIALITSNYTRHLISTRNSVQLVMY